MLRGFYIKETVLAPDGQRKPVGRSHYFQAIASHPAKCALLCMQQARLSLFNPVIVGVP